MLLQKLFVLSFIFLSWAGRGFAQDSFSIEVSVSEGIDINDIIFSSIEEKIPTKLIISEEGGKYLVKGQWNSRYVRIWMSERKADKVFCSHSFWLIGDRAKITIEAIDKRPEACSDRKFHLDNMIDLSYYDQQYSNFYNKESEYHDSLLVSQAKRYGSEALPAKDFELLIASKRKITEKQMEYIYVHKDQYYSFVRFAGLINYNEVVVTDHMLNIFNSFPEKFKISIEGKEVAKTIYGKMQKEGSIALDFDTTDVYGNTISLQQMRGRYVMLVFWATWCGPCVREIPAIKEIRKKYPSKNQLEIVSISLDAPEDKDKVVNFIDKRKMNWNQIFNNPNLVRDYGVWAVPKTLLIDRTGKIILMSTGTDLEDLNILLMKEFAKK